MGRICLFNRETAKRVCVCAVAAVIMLIPAWTTAEAEVTRDKDKKNKAACWERKGKLAFGPSARIGSCMGSPYFDCPKGPQTAIEFWDKKCGPTAEDCGCKIVEACSKPEHIKCYQEYIADKEAMDCYTNPTYNNYEATKCYEKLIKSRQGKK